MIPNSSDRPPCPSHGIRHEREGRRPIQKRQDERSLRKGDDDVGQVNGPRTINRERMPPPQSIKVPCSSDELDITLQGNRIALPSETKPKVATV
mmetsp:Transcript_416/g.1344  ORF Transcript_416/g.1344 Transcript_416/m.1344 type:complete len:94 (+) Transcript_416:307-588(+)|eukprot:scaffold29917_cov36-Tisochrysis_lutea.AAC.8